MSDYPSMSREIGKARNAALAQGIDLSEEWHFSPGAKIPRPPMPANCAIYMKPREIILAVGKPVEPLVRPGQNLLTSGGWRKSNTEMRWGIRGERSRV